MLIMGLVWEEWGMECAKAIWSEEVWWSRYLRKLRHQMVCRAQWGRENKQRDTTLLERLMGPGQAGPCRPHAGNLSLFWKVMRHHWSALSRGSVTFLKNNNGCMEKNGLERLRLHREELRGSQEKDNGRAKSYWWDEMFGGMEIRTGQYSGEQGKDIK